MRRLRFLWSRFNFRKPAESMLRLSGGEARFRSSFLVAPTEEQRQVHAAESVHLWRRWCWACVAPFPMQQRYNLFKLNYSLSKKVRSYATARSYHGRMFAPRRSIPSVSSARASGVSCNFTRSVSATRGQEKVPCSRRLPLPAEKNEHGSIRSRRHQPFQGFQTRPFFRDTLRERAAAFSSNGFLPKSCHFASHSLSQSPEVFASNFCPNSNNPNNPVSHSEHSCANVHRSRFNPDVALA